jgi:hypothetical protein
MTDHVWIEITDLESLPERVWMCNVHPGEEVRRKQWEPEPTTTDEIERLRGLLARLEWSGGMCPACHVLPSPDRHLTGYAPHDPGCWLAAELQRRDPPD